MYAVNLSNFIILKIVSIQVCVKTRFKVDKCVSQGTDAALTKPPITTCGKDSPRFKKCICILGGLETFMTYVYDK